MKQKFDSIWISVFCNSTKIQINMSHIGDIQNIYFHNNNAKKLLK